MGSFWAIQILQGHSNIGYLGDDVDDDIARAERKHAWRVQ